jgi:hypothetical protein
LLPSTFPDPDLIDHLSVLCPPHIRRTGQLRLDFDQAIAVAPGSKEGLPALPPDNVRFPTTAGWALLNFQQSGPRSSLFFL